MITNINEFKKQSDSNSYSNDFASWFTGTVLNTVKHPIYGNHKLTSFQIKKSTPEYKTKLYKAIKKAINNGDINDNINFNNDVKLKNVNESAQYYIDKGYITNDTINNDEELIIKIEENINQAYIHFSNTYDLPGNNPILKINNKRITLNADIDLSEVGIFKNVIHTCNLSFFSGGNFDSYFDEETSTYYFKPIIWSTLVVAYEAISGGSNSMNYIIDNEGNNIYYDIIKGIFFIK